VADRWRVWNVCAGALLMAGLTAPPAAAEPPPDPGPNPAYNGAPGIVSGGPVPTLAGVPCVGGNLGVCVAIAQHQPPERHR